MFTEPFVAFSLHRKLRAASVTEPSGCVTLILQTSVADVVVDLFVAVVVNDVGGVAQLVRDGGTLSCAGPSSL